MPKAPAPPILPPQPADPAARVAVEADVRRCANCLHYSAKVLLPDRKGNGKCFEIMKATVTHDGSYGIVDADFFCACFVEDVGA